MWCGQVQCCLGGAMRQRLPYVGLRATCSMAAHTHTTHAIRYSLLGDPAVGELLPSQRASDTLPWGRTSVGQCAIPRMLAAFMDYVPASGESLTIGAPTTYLRPSPT